jgi:hypothetical protein
VAKPGDAPGNFWLDLNVPSLPAGMEPIDSLQRLFDAWKTAVSVNDLSKAPMPRLFPNPSNSEIFIEMAEQTGRLQLFDVAGKPVFESRLVSGQNRLAPNLQPGAYFARITIAEGKVPHTLRLVWQGN